jgi:hypothetical protein
VSRGQKVHDVSEVGVIGAKNTIHLAAWIMLQILRLIQEQEPDRILYNLGGSLYLFNAIFPSSHGKLYGIAPSIYKRL